MYAIALIILVLVVATVAVLAVRSSVILVHEGQVAIVKRLGRFHRVAPPGPTFVLPMVDEYKLVITSPQRYVVPAGGFTADGVHVAIEIALVTRVIDPRLVSRHSRSIDSQARDATANAVVSAIGTLSSDEVLRGGDRVVAAAAFAVDEALAAIGLAADSLRAGPPRFAQEYAGALASTAVALRRRQGELERAHTDKATLEVQAAARAAELAILNRVARKLHPNALAVQRLATLRAVADGGGQLTVLMGLDETDLRTAVPLPPPGPVAIPLAPRRLRDAS